MSHEGGDHSNFETLTRAPFSRGAHEADSREEESALLISSKPASEHSPQRSTRGKEGHKTQPRKTAVAGATVPALKPSHESVSRGVRARRGGFVGAKSLPPNRPYANMTSRPRDAGRRGYDEEDHDQESSVDSPRDETEVAEEGTRKSLLRRHQRVGSRMYNLNKWLGSKMPHIISIATSIVLAVILVITIPGLRDSIPDLDCTRFPNGTMYCADKVSIGKASGYASLNIHRGDSKPSAPEGSRVHLALQSMSGRHASGLQSEEGHLLVRSARNEGGDGLTWHTSAVVTRAGGLRIGKLPASNDAQSGKPFTDYLNSLKGPNVWIVDDRGDSGVQMSTTTVFSGIQFANGARALGSVLPIRFLTSSGLTHSVLTTSVRDTGGDVKPVMSAGTSGVLISDEAGVASFPLHVKGSIFARSWGPLSDRRFKNIHREVQPEESMLLLQDLPVYEYTYRNDPDKRVKRGPIAQDIQKIMPWAVLEDRERMLHVDMSQMLPETMNALRHVMRELDLLHKKSKKTIQHLHEELRASQEKVRQLEVRCKSVQSSRS